jgi:signal transduction histidine kinase
MTAPIPEPRRSNLPNSNAADSFSDALVGATLAERLAFLNLGKEQSEQLRSLVSRFQPHAAEFVETFYRHIFGFERTAVFLQDEKLVSRLKRAQQEHLQTLLEAEWNEEYVSRRRRVGEVHAQVGLRPQLFLGAYNQYLQFWLKLLCPEGETDNGASEIREILGVLIPAVLLDIGLTLDSYFVQLTDDMRQALEMYWKANNELRQFAQLTSHDLKTPLGTVANLCEEALDEFGSEMPEGARDLIARARERVYRMSDTIDELLTATIDSPGPEIDETVASGPLLEELSDTLRPLYMRRQVELHLGPHLPMIVGDRARLREIFMNLLTNAAKYIDKRPGKVEVLANIEGDQCVFEVRDNGSGIPLDEQQRIFSPFRRLRSHQHIPGSGLGLYFTRNLVEQLGGRVWVESTEKVGSSFFVSLRKGKEE